MKIRNIGEPHKEKWWKKSSARTHLVYYLIMHHILDDQGRCLVDYDEICHELREKSLNVSSVRQSVTELAHDGVLMLYTDSDGSEYAQSIGWWKLQCNAKFMQRSKLPAPPGWEDAWRITGPGRKIIKSDNWDDKEDSAGLISVSTSIPHYRVSNSVNQP